MSEISNQDENGAKGKEKNPMVQRILLEVQRREPNSIKELVLDNCSRCHSIEGLTEDFSNLRVLSIINVGLQSLIKFPPLPKLRKLYLSDNRLNSGLENLQGCPNLTLLILAGNKFKSIDELKPLMKLSKLSILDLMNCEVTKLDDYRQTIFQILSQLKYLDNVDKEGVEKDSEDEEDNEDEDEDDEEEYEEDDSKAGLKALYNDDEDSYSDDEDNPIEEAPKGEKRKHLEENTDGPPRKL